MSLILMNKEIAAENKMGISHNTELCDEGYQAQASAGRIFIFREHQTCAEYTVLTAGVGAHDTKQAYDMRSELPITVHIVRQIGEHSTNARG